MSGPLQIIFAGGGTAGHLFPGLAVAAELAALPSRPQIAFAGSGKLFERKNSDGSRLRIFAAPLLADGPWRARHVAVRRRKSGRLSRRAASHAHTKNRRGRGPRRLCKRAMRTRGH